MMRAGSREHRRYGPALLARSSAQVDPMVPSLYSAERDAASEHEKPQLQIIQLLTTVVRSRYLAYRFVTFRSSDIPHKSLRTAGCALSFAAVQRWPFWHGFPAYRSVGGRWLP